MLKVARFYQLENKMNATMDAELALLGRAQASEQALKRYSGLGER